MSGKNLSILTFNFVSIPFVSKNLRIRLDCLVKEIKRIQPDIICFQEIWLGYIRKRLIFSLRPLGYQFYYPTPGAFFNGLLTCSKYNFSPVKALDLKGTFNGFNRLLIESLGSKGYSLIKIKLPNKKKLFAFNTHLSCH